MSGDTLRMIAEAFRVRAEQTEPAFSTSKIIECCFPDAVVTGRSLPPGVHEIVTVTGDGPLIMYQRGLPTPDQRFAIAHAIGHLVFDFRHGRSLAPLNDESVEARADEFAAELLVPLDELAPYVGRFPAPDDPVAHELYLDQVDQIASHFHVPARVVDQQIRKLPR